MERVEGQDKPHSAALQHTRSPSWTLPSPLQTSREEGEETAPAGMPDDRGKHWLSSVRGSSADKETPEDMKIDLLLPSPTGTSHSGSRPLLDCAVMIRHS